MILREATIKYKGYDPNTLKPKSHKRICVSCITKSIGIFIPSELHNHIRHNLKNGQNMGEINMLAIQFINGGL